MGRTARGTAGKGRALLFLTPEELGFLRYLRSARVPLNEYEFPTAKLANVQAQLEKLVAKNYYLHAAAREAYRSYLLAYNSHALKEVYNVHRLDLAAVASSFGFQAPPRVSLNLESKAKHARGAKREAIRGGGSHAFSAKTPYGRKNDARQFAG